MRILVTGATGYVGSRPVTALLADQHGVVAATHDPHRLKRLGWSADVTPVHAGVRVNGIATAVASVVTAIALPVPDGLAGDLVASPGHPMIASETGLRDRVPDPPVARPTLRPVNHVPSPLAGAARTGLDMLIALNPKVRPA